MAKKTNPAALTSWTAAIGASAEEIKAAWEDSVAPEARYRPKRQEDRFATRPAPGQQRRATPTRRSSRWFLVDGKLLHRTPRG